MRYFARKTAPSNRPAPLLWIKLAQPVGQIPAHGTVLHKAESGQTLATIEADHEWQSIHSTIGIAYRWRVFYGGIELGTDCASTVGFCMQKAAQFVSDSRKYPHEAHKALLEGGNQQ